MKRFLIRRAMATTSNSGKYKNGNEGDEKEENSMFECNICLDTAKDAVVSMCGHLFCWPCLHQWFETRPNSPVCPVCKATISRDKVIPLYGRGSNQQEDPRNKVPPRPAGQRTEPENNNAFPGFGFGEGGFHMSFGIGAFPFGFITSTFTQNDARPHHSHHQQPTSASTASPQDEESMSKLFMYMALIIFLWLLFA